MKKIRKTLKAIVAITKNPWLLNNVLADDAVWQQYLEKNYQLKNGLPVVDINQLSPNFPETLDCIAFLDGSSLPTDFALLKSLTKKFKDCSYFEIGTWRGESVMNVADCCKECYTLNLSKEEILSLGLSEKYADLHGFFSKRKENIHHLTGNSLSYDFKSLNKKFDVIFIDGDHRYEYVKSDTENIFKHLLHDQSIVVWHDYAYNPEKYRPEVLSGILDGISKDFRKNLYHVSNTMCAIFIKENFSTSVLQSPLTPDKIFKVTLESHSIH
jgi:predicted O-methyltransferase YrrM